MQLRVTINDGANFAPMNVEQLAVHYKNFEVPQKAYSTREAYKRMLDDYVVPRWGNHSLASIKSIEVENWLGKGVRSVQGVGQNKPPKWATS